MCVRQTVLILSSNTPFFEIMIDLSSSSSYNRNNHLINDLVPVRPFCKVASNPLLELGFQPFTRVCMVICVQGPFGCCIWSERHEVFHWFCCREYRLSDLYRLCLVVCKHTQMETGVVSQFHFIVSSIQQIMVQHTWNQWSHKCALLLCTIYIFTLK